MELVLDLYRWLVQDRWGLGFIEEPLSDILNGQPYQIHCVTGIPKDRWYADPFILDYDENQIELLVEEWKYKINKGRIARLTIDRKTYQLLRETIILELDTHLSFPFIQRKDGKIYVSPENGSAGEWNQYEYSVNSDKLTRIRTTVSEPLTDAISTSLLGEELIFSTHHPIANKSVLSVYNAQGVRITDVQFPKNVARGAGDWFIFEDRVFRPAQDCSVSYGGSVIIQEVKRTGKSSFEFNDVIRLESNNPKYCRGLHTFNHYKDLTVVDVYGYRKRHLGKMTDSLLRLIKRLR